MPLQGPTLPRGAMWLVKQVVALSQPQAGGKKVELQSELPDTLRGLPVRGFSACEVTGL